MARLRAPLGYLEFRVPWVTEETVGSQVTLDTLVKRESKGSVENRVSRANPAIQDPGGSRDLKDQKAKRAQRESLARLEHQVGGDLRDCKGCQGPGVW